MTDHNRVLVVGNCARTLAHARDLNGAQIRAEGISSLFSAYWSDGAPPDIILAPLLAETFDIVDIIDRLVRFGFRGLLLAVSAPLPNARAVRREVGADCQGFQFDLVELAREPGTASDPAPEP